MTAKRVIVILDENGCFIGCVTDDGVEVYTGQPSLPHDRIYKLTPGHAQDVHPAQVDAFLAGEIIGSIDDGRTPDLAIDPPKPGRLQ